MDATQLIRLAEKGMDGRHPMHGFPIQNGVEHAVGYALLALVDEQKVIASQLAGIDITLGRIAKALEQSAESKPTSEPEPKRRLWLPTRRRAEA